MIPVKQLFAAGVTVILLASHRERRPSQEHTPVGSTQSLLWARYCCCGLVATGTDELEGGRSSCESDMTLLECGGARISGCWSLR